MAFLRKRFLILVLILICLTQSFEARKLKLGFQKTEVSSLKGISVLVDLPKGSVSFSTPSNKGHANEIHFSHLPAHVDRSLESVPSPGIGH
ncbi:hypothetical protein M9H77_21684 [Catharanthus roseus]|uniref:Uncharacterized protein n=1 Tax=Catharanthus roseus TaxID=4058 RepID=A0ACC0AP16_CATRO|nr:hypothetical protein M9H77_21684 [Catharanthus roseus]